MVAPFRLNPLACLGLVPLLGGCQTSGPDAERGPDKTVAQYLKVESSVPGISIETNGVYAGKTPLTLRIFGDAAGRFHSFGSPEYVLRALPLTTNQFLQTKVFRTGKRSSPGESVPGLVFFDMSQPAGAMQIDSFPER
jgi:hypothetical protein